MPGPNRDRYVRVRPEATLPPGVPICHTIRVEEARPGRWVWKLWTPVELRGGAEDREAAAWSAARAALREVDPNAGKRWPYLAAVRESG